MKFRTKAIHIGNQRDPQTGAVVPPIHFASTFVQHEAGEWRDFDYSRSGNPTRKNFETTMASLEGGCGALAFSSGMAAIHAVTMLLNNGLLNRGERIIAGSDIYGGTFRLLHHICNRADINVTLTNASDLQSVEQELQKGAKLLWIESPGNPLMSITDIAACAKLAHQYGTLLAVDSTFASPALTNPLELDADIVMHSATKYIGGHSDLLGGCLVVKDQTLLEDLYFIQNATGAVMGPMECFLASRGLKTLQLRMFEQCRTAQKIAHWLSQDSRVQKVYYPGLPSHPGHEIAAKQMQGGFGAMISFEIKGDFQAAKHIADHTKIFQLAVSLGAVESLIEQPASMSHASYDAAARAKFGITDSLIRLSIGLEDVEDLQDDLDQAMQQ